ncbi:hypothetical protein [uncultured Methanobrevibacter sp.]|uniref:hypothetical protein n=1 Tax=uncultured Methanobrevibacter sp. TaxID=253161 RepID=UPI0025D76502|nr:hypothetical protein [uncultured Methanobrevibacter sp.]
MLNKFKNLVDNIPASIHNEKEFMKEYRVDIEEESINYIEKAISNDLRTKIANLNYPLGKINRNTFNMLKEELIYREVILNENSIPYLKIIETFFYINPYMERLAPFDDEKWAEVIECCKNYLNFKNYNNLSKDNLKEHFPKEYNRSESVRYLMDKGCKIKIENNKIDFIYGLDNILIELDKKIESFGGINLIIEIFNNVEYSSEFKRFYFMKNTDILNQNKNLETPWGYLFNLALKHPNFKHYSKRKKYERLYNEIKKLSEIIVNGVYDVQEYNIFNHIFQNEQTFPQHVSDLVLYDSLFRVPQGNIDLELKLCEYFFSFEDDFFESTLGFSLEEFISIIEQLKNISQNSGNRIMLRLSKKEDYVLDYYDYLKILNFMSHKDNINYEYIFPADYLKIDFYKRPLIKLDQTSFFIPTIPVISPNFYEVIADNLRKPYKKQFKQNLDDVFGTRLELLIRHLFDERSIIYIPNSKFSHGKCKGESDFIIETDKSIILIEVKKKVLRRESKAGYNYRIFMDLFGSFVKSQFQANKLEYLLKKYGKVELDLEDETKYILSLNERHVKRISLTQLEYGSLYNPNFIEYFLYTLIYGEYVLENGDDKLNDEFEEFKKDIIDFNESYNKLNEIEEINFKEYAHANTYFMSLSQLFEVIKKSSDNNSFYKNLPNQLMEFGTFDWFYEYGRIINSRNKHENQ